MGAHGLSSVQCANVGYVWHACLFQMRHQLIPLPMPNWKPKPSMYCTFQVEFISNFGGESVTL